MGLHFLYLLLLFSLGSFGQSVSAQYAFETIGVQNGLPGSKIKDFIQDQRGYYWVATEGNGLLRYDSYSLDGIDLESNSKSQLLNSIALDADSLLWGATENGFWKYAGFEIEEFKLPDEASVSKVFCIENKIYLSAKNGDFWAFADSTFNLLEIQNVKALAATKVGLVALSNNKIYQESKGKWLQVVGKRAYDIERAGDQWILATSDGVALYDLDWNFQYSLLKGSRVRDMDYRKGQLLFLTNKELYLSSLNDVGQLIQLKSGAEVQKASKVYIDNFQNKWLVQGGELLKLINEKASFYPSQLSSTSSIKFKNKIYSGSSSGPVVHNVNGESYLAKEIGFTLDMEEYKGKLYLATEQGLFSYDGQKFDYIPIADNQGGFIFCLKSSKDKLWIGTGNGIFCLEDSKLINISKTNDLEQLTIFDIQEADDKSVWFATYNNGFYKYDSQGWEQVLKIGNFYFDSLRYNSFSPISDDEMWIGTSNDGIYKLTKDSSIHFSPKQLQYAEVRSLITDNSSTLWSGSNKGLFSIKELGSGEWDIHLLSTNDGILGLSFSPNAIRKTEEGLLLSSSEGVQKLNFGMLESKHQVMISNMQLFYGDGPYSIYSFASTTSAFSNLPVNLSLPYDQNFINLKLSGLSSSNKGNIRYRYKLKPKNEDWIYTSDRREIVLANLDPAAYKLIVQSGDGLQNWSVPVHYTFRINQAFYKEWWFIAALILLIVGISLMVILDRVKRKRLREKLEADLVEMERKALRLQMNPHFVFNALDSISSFIFKKDPKQAVQYLNNFAKLMRLTLESSMEPLHPVETEVSILKNYLELEKLRFQSKFDYEIELDEEIDYDVGIPPMLIQPHVENAVLHGLKPRESGGKLKICFLLDGEFLICTITDNGIGREAAKKKGVRKDHRSMATQINIDRIALMKKAKSEGIDIQIIDLEDNKGNPSGTEVQIRLLADQL